MFHRNSLFVVGVLNSIVFFSLAYVQIMNEPTSMIVINTKRVLEERIAQNQSSLLSSSANVEKIIDLQTLILCMFVLSLSILAFAYFASGTKKQKM